MIIQMDRTLAAHWMLLLLVALYLPTATRANPDEVASLETALAGVRLTGPSIGQLAAVLQKLQMDAPNWEHDLRLLSDAELVEVSGVPSQICLCIIMI